MKLSRITFGLLLLFILSCTEQAKDSGVKKTEIENDDRLEVLLIGTSHWRSYKKEGSDYAQLNEIDVLSPKYQKEIEEISVKLANFNPSKIFVENHVLNQPYLDSLYQLYCTTDWGGSERNEIYQLGFRTAKKLMHDGVFGISNSDYAFPLDSVKRTAQKYNQADIITEFDNSISDMTTDYRKLVEAEADLTDILRHWNSSAEDQRNLGWYVNIINRIGSDDNYAGSNLATNMYKNNLNILGLLQRKVEAKDKRIVVLFGSAHTAMLKDLIRYIPDWKVVDLMSVIE